MKILLADENRGFGGSEVFLLQLGDALARRGHQVELWVRRDSWLAAQPTSLVRHTTTFSGELDVRALWRLSLLQSRRRYDVIHCQASRDLVVAATLRRWRSDFRLIKSEHCFLGPQRSRLLESSYRQCDRIVAVSAALQSQLQHELPELSPWVIHNGIALPLEVAEPPSRLRQGRWIGYVSSFLESKGQRDALQACLPLLQADPQLHLLLAGDGPTRPALLEEAAASGLAEQIWLPGHVERPLDYLSGLELVLLPTHQETFSLVALESQALGKALVAYRVGGLPEVVEDGTSAILVEPGDVAGLREAVRRYLDDAAMRHSHGAAGRRRVHKSFSIESMINHYENSYRA